MVENKTLDYLKDLFKDFSFKEKITFFPNNGYSNYIIETKYGYKINIYYEYVDNLYNIKIEFSNDSICLSSYEIYKKFVKSNLKKGLFVKHNLDEHLNVLYKFINENKEIIRKSNEFVKKLCLTSKLYENIII